MTTTKNINLSDQALGAVMMALQNSLMTQTDIVPVLKGFNFIFDENEDLVVTNPPILRTEEGSDPESDQACLDTLIAASSAKTCLKRSTQ